MQKSDEITLKQLINEAEVVSFDVFDTLLFRKVDTPETIFDIIGKCFNIHGFRKLRVDCQNEASRRTYAFHQYPHADMDEIYEVLSEHTEIPVDWQQVKEFEVQIEKDALVCNPEMLEVYRYAKSLGKRVIATSDMYLFAQTLSEILEAAGYADFDYVYCSADEHKAKFNKELFALVAERENVSYEKILHIGDNRSADVEIPGSFGIKTFLYERDYPREDQSAPSSGIDMGLTKILYNPERSFWYNLGITAGGPLYMGLYQWLAEICRSSEKKVFFLSRDGYNICQLLKEAGFDNVEYLYMSRRSMVLAGITDMDEASVRELPPYTLGQTVEEILNYLRVSKEEIRHLQDAGFTYFNDKITSLEDLTNFKKLYTLDKDVFLPICEKERADAIAYFKEIGFLEEDSLVFDCGWNGSSQHLLERFKKAICSEVETPFLYFGIRNTEKSRRQLHGRKYETYAFDFYKNYSLQRAVDAGIVVFEQFFTAPHESVYFYDKGAPVLEAGNGKEEQADLLAGIRDYLTCALPFAEKYTAGVEYTPDVAIGHLYRLVVHPTEEEALQIGNLSNVDGFARQQGEEKKIAFLTERQYEANNHAEVYWLQGFVKRSDIPEKLKTIIAKREGSKYPPAPPAEYHLEDRMSIRNYYRWLHNQNEQKPEDLAYRPKFSVVIPVYNTVSSQLEEAFDSVLAQTYDNYELILVDDASTWQNVVPVLKKYEENEHVTVIYRTRNGHISEATNDAIAVSAGDFIIFMDCDDTVEPNALYEIAALLNENPNLDFIYSDEDKITEDGKIRHMPFFKPDWSPELFMSMMYTNHLGVYRASLAHKTGGLRTAFNGSQDYDFTMRFLELSDNRRVGHVPKILYHWRERKESVAYEAGAKNYAVEAGGRAKEEMLARRGIRGKLEYSREISTYLVVYEPVGQPLVSIIIPSRDHPEILKQCVTSIRNNTDYAHYELIVVDNGSSDQNREQITGYLKRQNAKYIYDRYDFNFSRMCNLGAKEAAGEYLLFLNDDIEIIQRDWLTRLLGQAQQPTAGAVGAKLLYPGTKLIQHDGVSDHPEGPDHNFLRLDDTFAYYFGFNRVNYNCLAVTAACLMVRREIFEQAEGFDESFPVAYNDVDLCMKIVERGLYNTVRNDVIAYHHESLSRGNDALDEKKLTRLHRERSRLYRKHPGLRKQDPFLNPNLHKYGMYLNPKVKLDLLEEMPGLRMKEAGECRFDTIARTDKVWFSGWSYVPEVEDNRETTRYLVLEDAYGNCFRAKARSIYRPDVAASRGREDLEMSGLECTVDMHIIRTDLMPYQVGVLTCAGKENYITWSKYQTAVTDETQKAPLFCEMLEKGVLKKPENSGGQSETVPYDLDKIELRNKSFLLTGWAFYPTKYHFLYRTQVLLEDENGNDCVFRAKACWRPEAERACSGLLFLQRAGFSCRIYPEQLPAGHSYQVILRLVNQLDPADVHNVSTGMHIMVTGAEESSESTETGTEEIPALCGIEMSDGVTQGGAGFETVVPDRNRIYYGAAPSLRDSALVRCMKQPVRFNKEKGRYIQMATIEYLGQDTSGQYSDGEQVEKDILQYAETCSAEEFPRIIQEDQRWAVFYHLTEIRENILNWYDFTPGCDVLEIGAGMGALTGLLCRKAGTVTAVELTPERAKVIYARHKEQGNLKILVGNFNEIEFEQKFDYITLIGVLEYATGFTPGGMAEDFLNRIQSLLKPGGKLLIAIENRFGCKYWCGAKEDHVGKPYAGINGYENVKGIRTYSREELSDLLNRCGLSAQKFFYPLPDYKLPQILYSDEMLPTDHIPDKILSYYPDNQTLFSDERKIYDAAIRDRVFPFFANSFFVECGKNGAELSRASFAAFTRVRKTEYQTVTVIRNDGTVRKKAANPTAEAFLREIVDQQEHFQGGRLAPYRPEGAEIAMPLLKGRTLESLLKEKILQEDPEGAADLLKKLYQGIRESGGMKPGDAEDMLDYGFLDLTPGNTFVDDQGEFTFFDQEWMDRNVPASFILFRGIRTMYVENPELEEHIPLHMLLNRFIPEKNAISLYEAREMEFLTRVAPAGGSSFAYLEQHRGTVDERLIEETAEKKYYATCFFNTGNGYSEENKAVFEYSNPKDLRLTVNVPENTVSVRFDPVEGLFCVLGKLTFLSNEGILDYTCLNGVKRDSACFFLSTDPQMEVKLDGPVQEIRIQAEASLFEDYGPVYLLGELQKEEAENRNLKDKISQDEQHILYLTDSNTLMQHSISWKLTKPIRKISRMLKR